MIIKSKVVRNASWIILCRVAQAILNLIVGMITARYLGPSNFGIINYAASIVAFILPIACLGLDNILVQETIQNASEEGKIFGTSLILSFCASFLSLFSVMCFVAFVNAGEKETIIVCSLYSLILLVHAIELIQYWFQARYLSKYVSLISLGAYVIISAYKIFLLVTGKSVYWFAVSNTLDHLMIAVALVITYNKLGGGRLRFSWVVARRMLMKSRYYIVSSMMVTVFAQTDKIMLKIMIDSAATGYYSAAVTCAGMTSFVFSAIIDSMRPAVLQARTEAAAKCRENMRRLYSIVIYLALVQSLMLTLCAKPVIMILYGKAYEAAVDPLRIVVWYTTFSYMGAVRNIWILAEEKQRYLWIINLSGASLNVIMNLLIIPQWGINGAALASLLTQFFTNYILGFIIKPIRENNRIVLEALDIRYILADVRRLLSRE